MYFEAELKGQKYKVDVTEGRHTWKVSLQQEGKEWKHYDIAKSDYREAEEYISFLFGGKSYLVDVLGQDTEYTVFTRNSFRTITGFTLMLPAIQSEVSHSCGTFASKVIICIAVANLVLLINMMQI